MHCAATGQGGDLAATGHLQIVMIDQRLFQAGAAHQRAVIAQQCDGLVTQRLQQRRALIHIELEAAKAVIRHALIKAHRVLIAHQQAVFLCRYAHIGRGVGMEHRIDFRSRLEDAGVDDQPAADVARSVLQWCAIEVEFLQAGGGDFLEHHVARLEQQALRLVGQAQRHMHIRQVVEAEMRQHPVHHGQVHARLPFFRTDRITQRG